MVCPLYVFACVASAHLNVQTYEGKHDDEDNDYNDDDSTSSGSQTKGSCKAFLQCAFSYAPETSSHYQFIILVDEYSILPVIKSDTAVQN